MKHPTGTALAPHCKGNELSCTLQLITYANPGQFTDYLKRAHSYFLQYLLPSIRSKLIEAVDTADASGLGIAIIRYYDQFVGEVRRHMDDEDSRLFPYVRALINSERPTGSACRYIP